MITGSAAEQAVRARLTTPGSEVAIMSPTRSQRESLVRRGPAPRVRHQVGQPTDRPAQRHSPPWTRPVEADYSWLAPVTRDLELRSPDEHGQRVRSLLTHLDDSSTCGCYCALHLDGRGPKTRSNDTNEEMAAWPGNLRPR